MFLQNEVSHAKDYRVISASCKAESLLFLAPSITPKQFDHVRDVEDSTNPDCVSGESEASFTGKDEHRDKDSEEIEVVKHDNSCWMTGFFLLANSSSSVGIYSGLINM